MLPALLITGVGMGLIFAPAMSGATAGVAPTDAGVASAMVNTAQQVGGSIGTALLSTLAANALDGWAAGRPRTPQVLAEAAVHGYVTAFWWAAAIFVIGAVLTAALLPNGAPELEPGAEPALAH